MTLCHILPERRGWSIGYITKTSVQTDRVCRGCALWHESSKKLCPAFGKTCFKCNGKNHLSVKCKLSSKKKVLTVETTILWWQWQTVIEGISYFCLARNLIRPLESAHNFTQSGWLILFIPDHFPGQQKLWKPSNTLHFHRTSFRTDVLLSALQLQQQQHRHNEESHLIYGPLASILLDQGFPVEYELDEFNT